MKTKVYLSHVMLLLVAGLVGIHFKHKEILSRAETEKEVAINNLAELMDGQTRDIERISDELREEADELQVFKKLYETETSITSTLWDMILTAQSELDNAKFLSELDREIQQSVQTTRGRLAEIQLTKAQNAHMHSVRVQDDLEDELDRVNDNYLFETKTLRDDLQSANTKIHILNDEVSKLLRREAELAEQLSNTRKVLSMVPRSRGVLVH